jgi:phosphotransferase system HPr-like phosphotransfer protein
MEADLSSRAVMGLFVPGLSQAGPLAMGLGPWRVPAGLLCVAGLAAWMAWKHRRDLGRWLHLEYEITERIAVTDPHGFHMRRCGDLVQVARKHVTYNIHLRHHSGGGMTWASARSLMGLMSLGVRGPLPGQAPPVVEVKIHGLRPGKVLRQVRRVLEERPEKYMSLYELAALAEKAGGALVVRRTPQQTGRPRKLADLLASIRARIGRRLRTGQGPRKAPES